MKKILCPSALLFLFALLPPQTTHAQSGSNFVQVTLPRGIELKIPKGWWLLSADLNQAIQDSADVIIGLSGEGPPDGQETNLIAANSMPRSTYAAVRVSSTIPPSVAPSEFASITTADIRDLQSEMRQNFQKLLPLQGNLLIEFLGTRIETISGHPAVVTEYRRTSPEGPVFVQINQVFTFSQEIRISLSYRESEVALWKPVVEKIRRSIVIRPSP
ncbi:MAG: hypothetical protein H5U26_08445 [Immundisolibacter sp.]|uniref:hypothetical protein n=1 Tax=Immundisolibacter sp. TaxID=1934948 RepID=UPI0019A56C5A|nr:hypothetical protein [Immundisolibacter sp.]MBC7162122.1 hypothetical protein [Immundisolibacter sp.]